MDFFLNVLLFIPFGFGLSAQMCKRGGRRWTSAVLALVAGACVSYSVELLQLYIPGRDSGWEDVISNTTGSVAGFLLFVLWGGAVLGIASRYADWFEGWLSLRRMAALLVIYFAVCFGGSVLMQEKTRLSNWDPQSSLIVGNDANGQNPWRGQVFLLQIWNRALPVREIQAMQAIGSTGGQGPSKLGDAARAGLLGSYDFMGAPPYQDQRTFLPELAWNPAPPQLVNARAPETDARSWLRTTIPVGNLTQEIKKTNQFTVRMICAPAATENARGRIVSLSQSSDDINFHLRQEGTNLVLWFRNPLSETNSMLAWTVRGAFASGKVRDIVASYDGADAFLYLDGQRVPRIYRLTPGATLLHTLSSIKTADLHGALLVYETLIFLPAGLLIGLQAGAWSKRKISALWILALGLLLPAILLELLLVEVSGRTMWLENIAFSFAFGVAGILLMNADRRHLKHFLK